MTEQALQARMHFERRIDAAAKKAAAVVLRDADPVRARQVLRELLRKVAREAAQQPEIFA
jgi:hypothetical protein